MSLRHIRDPFQIDWPVFCKVPIHTRGKTLQPGQPFKWKEMQIELRRVRTMYQQGLLYHDADLAAAHDDTQVGDGLENLELESLHALVDKINEKVKAQVKTEKQWQQKKCPKSQIVDKQRGLIRRWRLTYGKMEVA